MREDESDELVELLSEDLADVAPLMEAAEHFATARARLPAPGKEFHGPKDAENFQAYVVALLALERAAMAHAGRKVKQL